MTSDKKSSAPTPSRSTPDIDENDVEEIMPEGVVKPAANNNNNNNHEGPPPPVKF